MLTLERVPAIWDGAERALMLLPVVAIVVMFSGKWSGGVIEF